MQDITTIVDARHGPEDIVQRALSSVREHLGMEIAYLSEFVGNDAIFRAVDAPGLEDLIKPGDSRSLDHVYCRHILNGTLPRLIPDTGAIPFAAELPITKAVPIGSHVSVPIRRHDGSVYGMFCCLSPRPNPTLNERDLSIMERFAELCAEQVNGAMSEKVRFEETESTVRDLLANARFKMVYQPIYDLDTHSVSGFEALCRFDTNPYRTPDKWFTDADTVGLSVDLELAAVDAALDALTALPENVYISVNASPHTVASGRLSEVFTGHPQRRIVLEITEHTALAGYDALLEEAQRLRREGITLAIDDAGAGHSGLQQIVRLSPEMVKLDMSLTTDIDTDPVKRSLATALVHFAAETGAVIVAEGIETAQEMETLRALGVHRGQGWHLGKPMSLEEAQALVLPAPLPLTA